MKKLRYYYWFIRTLAQKHSKVIITAAVIGALTFAFNSTLFRFIPGPKPTKYIGRIGLFDLSSLPPDILSLVSSGLTQLAPDGSAKASLANQWNVIDDGQTYVFSLSDSARWQDGTPLSSTDINYSFQDVQIQTPDTLTVLFKLPQPFSPFPVVVSQPLLKRTTKENFGLFTSTKIIGTGEYTITNLKNSGRFLQQLTLESNSQRLIYRFYNTQSAAITAFKLGEVDVLEDLTSPQDLSDFNNAQISTSQTLDRYAAIFFKTTDPQLSDKALRQSLTYAVADKPTDQTRALGPISPSSWAYNPQVKPYHYSLETAQQLIENTNTDFELELTTSPAFTDLAEKIKSSWESLGLNVKLKISANPDPDNFQALLIGQSIPDDPDQYLLWHSTQGSNITGYQSAKVDKLLEDGRHELDPDKRKLIYQDFQRFLLEDSPAAFLHYLTTTTVTRK